jgi:hypothetical protein
MWNYLFQCQARSWTDGSFEIRGTTTTRELLVSVWRPGFARIQRAAAAVGSSDLVLVLSAERFVAGRLLLDPGIARQELHLSLSPGEHVFAMDGSGESFVFRVDGAGPFGLGLQLPGEPGLLRVDGIESTLRNDEFDRRLDPLDVRGRIQVHRAKVVDEDGKPIERIGTCRDPGGTSGFANVVHWEQVRDGELRLLSSRDPLVVAIEAIGKRAQVVSLSGTAVETIVLAPGLLVQIIVDGGRPALPQGIALRATVVHDPARGGIFGLDHDDVGADGQASIRVSSPGSYVLRFSLETSSSDGAAVSAFLSRTERVELLDAHQPAMIHATLVEDDIGAALRQLGRD